MTNNSNLFTSIDTTKVSLKQIVTDLSSIIDPYKDLTQLSNEELLAYTQTVDTVLHKVNKLATQLAEPLELLKAEKKRCANASQTSIFTEEIIDTDGSKTIVSGTETVSKVYHRSAIDIETGLSISKNVTGVDVYSKPCVKVSKKKVDQAIANGLLSASCVSETKVHQYSFNFDSSEDVKKED